MACKSAQASVLIYKITGTLPFSSAQSAKCMQQEILINGCESGEASATLGSTALAVQHVVPVNGLTSLRGVMSRMYWMVCLPWKVTSVRISSSSSAQQHDKLAQHQEVTAQGPRVKGSCDSHFLNGTWHAAKPCKGHNAPGKVENSHASSSLHTCWVDMSPPSLRSSAMRCLCGKVCFLAIFMHKQTHLDRLG